MISGLKKKLSRQLKRKIKLSVRTLWQSLAYYFFRRRGQIGHLRHIVFVCLGNVCRSAFAEYYCKSSPLFNGLRIESCGLEVDQSVPSPPDALKIAEEFGVDLTENRSKYLAACDLEQADLIIAMEYDQFKMLIHKFPHKSEQIVLLREFAPWPESLICNIYDPYGFATEEFRNCFKAMRRALDGLAEQLKKDRKR